MHILLPPSEAKRLGGKGTPLGRRRRADALHPARVPLLAAVTSLTDPAAAATALHLPPSVVTDVALMHRRLLSSATMPAMLRYCGVLYQALDVATLSEEQQRTAGRQLLIFSGLFGVLRGGDPIPAYRVPASASLPGVAGVARYWRPRLAEVMPTLIGDGLVVDLRSTDYAAMWRPGAAVQGRVVTVRVLTPRPDGRLAVVSYDSKFGKGLLARRLVEAATAGQPAQSVHHVAGAWLAAGGADVEVDTAAGATRLDLVLAPNQSGAGPDAPGPGA